MATPSIISLLQSCTSDTSRWVPILFTEEQGVILTNLVDVFLPKTETPSASDVNVPEFIDKYINEVPDLEDQNRFKAGIEALVAKIKTDYHEKLNKVTEENYKDLLDNNMLLRKEQPPTSESEPMTVSDVLNALKSISIWAYANSETVGETVLVYDPVPAAYFCGDLDELTGGKSWSLENI